MTNPPSAPPPLAQSLDELRLKARSPEAEAGAVDALVRALQQVKNGRDEPGLAEVLNLVVEDPYLGGLRDGAGTWVDAAAARALVVLGEPYASTLSAKAREALKRAAAEARRSRPLKQPPAREQPSAREQSPDVYAVRARYSAATLFLGYAVYESLFLTDPMHRRLGIDSSLLQAYVLGTLVLPTLVWLCSRSDKVHRLTAKFMLVPLMATGLVMVGSGQLDGSSMYDSLLGGELANLLVRLFLTVCLVSGDRGLKPAT